MTSQHMQCFHVGVHMICCHVQFAKVKYEALINNTVGKYLSLIVIVLFSHETIHSGGIEMLSLRGE